MVNIEASEHEFILLPPTDSDALWRGIIYKESNPHKGKVFRFVMNRYISMASHYGSLTDAQCGDFMKTARELTSEEYLAIFEMPEIAMQVHPGIYRSRDYRHS